jgi:pSer/pThr/pTyr-binding forkhead associated (FHA) protein
MQWCLLRSHEATDAKHDELINALNQQLDEGTKELWKCHELALASGEKPPENDKDTDEQQINQREPGSDVKYIHVEVTDGPYVGKTYKLQPRKRAACWVGRSAGKKFVEKGISLSKDDEVSTTHGKFELTNGKAFFTDTGSTNGTVHAGQELEDNIPLELQDGMFLKMGCTTVKITLLYT